MKSIDKIIAKTQDITQNTAKQNELVRIAKDALNSLQHLPRVQITKGNRQIGMTAESSRKIYEFMEVLENITIREYALRQYLLKELNK